jgi:hypothetical protein
MRIESIKISLTVFIEDLGLSFAIPLKVHNFGCIGSYQKNNGYNPLGELNIGYTKLALSATNHGNPATKQPFSRRVVGHLSQSCRRKANEGQAKYRRMPII